MRIRELLENPNGGQPFSAYLLLIAAIALALFVFGGVVLKLLHGEPVDFNRDGILTVVVSATAIPALIKFVRSRHAR